MFEKILYPTDFSEVSLKALDFIKKLKDCGTREVIIIHVIDVRDIEFLSRYASRDFLDIEKNLEEKTREAIHSMKDDLKESGLNVKTRIERGIPFMEILRVGDEENVSTIIVGSHGKSNIQEMFLGSISEKVIRKSHVPVLVVKR